MLLAATLKDPPILTRMLFEDPWPIIVALVIVWAILRIAGRRIEDKRLVASSWGVLALIAGVMAVSILVVTPREKLVAAMDRLLLAVEEGDVAGFHAIVPEDATATYFGVELDRSMVDARLGEADVADLTLLSREAGMINDQHAVYYIRVRARGGTDGIEGLDVSDWSIEWRLIDGRWQAIRFEHQGSGVQKLFGEP